MLPLSTLFGVVDDCSICPFSEENSTHYGSAYHCTGSPDVYTPCVYMEEYCDKSFRETITIVNGYMREHTNYCISQASKHKEKQIRNNELRKKRMYTRNGNVEINTKIKQCRKAIRVRQTRINMLESLLDTESVFSGIYVNQGKDCTPEILRLAEENSKTKQLMDSLIAQRDLSNKENRKKTK